MLCYPLPINSRTPTTQWDTRAFCIQASFADFKTLRKYATQYKTSSLLFNSPMPSCLTIRTRRNVYLKKAYNIFTHVCTCMLFTWEHERPNITLLSQALVFSLSLMRAYIDTRTFLTAFPPVCRTLRRASGMAGGAASCSEVSLIPFPYALETQPQQERLCGAARLQRQSLPHPHGNQNPTLQNRPGSFLAQSRICCHVPVF